MTKKYGWHNLRHIILIGYYSVIGVNKWNYWKPICRNKITQGSNPSISILYILEKQKELASFKYKFPKEHGMRLLFDISGGPCAWK